MDDMDEDAHERHRKILRLEAPPPRFPRWLRMLLPAALLAMLTLAAASFVS